MIRLTWGLTLALGLVSFLATGCATLTPEQAAGLTDARQFADQVTDAYGAGHVRVVAADESGYDGSGDFIAIAPRFLASDDRRLMMALFLGAPTLRLREANPRNHTAAQQRGIEIMVRFLGMTERQATDRIARLLLAHNEYLREDARRRGFKDWHLSWVGRGYLHPCQQLHDLWAIYRRADPEPECDPTFPQR